MIYQISSRQNEKVKEVVKLFQTSEKKTQQKFIVEGFHLLDMAIASHSLISVYTTEEIPTLASDIPQYLVTSEIMEKISSLKSPQGVVAICSMKKAHNLTSNQILYLDDIADPGNVGTLLRTALAFGYHDVILSKNCCSIYNEKVIQASQGAIFYLNVVEDNASLLKNLKDYQILATEIKGSVGLNEIKIPQKYILVLGNEAHGVKKEILDLASQRIRIDIKDIESLNVAVAGGIFMYSLTHR